MRIVFIGSVEFSARTLEALVGMGADVVGVCTSSRPGGNADHVDLAPIARAAGIDVLDTPDVNDAASVAWIASRRPDVIFCFGWSRLLKAPLLAVAPLGVVGFHPSALPANRGRHPIIWALALGLRETASTFFFMDAGADTGDILSQVPVPILGTDDARTLYDRIVGIAIDQLRAFVPALAAGRHERVPQDASRANAWRKRSADDGRIDWRMTATSIHALVRALTRPYVGAHFVHQGRAYTVWRAEVEADAPMHLEPGKVLTVDGAGVLVKAGAGAVRLVEVDPPFTIAPGAYL